MEKKLSKQVYVLCTGIFATMFANMVYPMLTMILQKYTSFTPFMISVVLGVDSVMLLIASLTGGKIADQFNKKHIIILLDIISALLYVIGGLIPFGALTVGLIILAGSLQQAEIASYNTLIAESTDDENMDKGFANFYLFLNAGVFISTAISGFLIAKNMKLVFFINAGGILISTLIIALFLKPAAHKDEKEEQKETVSIRSAFKVFKIAPILILFLIIKGIWEPIHYEYSYLIPMELDRVLSSNQTEIYGTLVSFSCLCILICTTPVTNLFHKCRVTTKIQLSNIAIGAGYGIMLIALILSFIPLMYLGFFVYIIGEIFDSISYETYIMRKTPEQYRGRIYGIFSTTLKIFVMLFNLLLGFLYEKDPMNGWVLLFVSLFLIIILTEVMAKWEAKTQKKEESGE